jgi:hypothetical protein
LNRQQRSIQASGAAAIGKTDPLQRRTKRPETSSGATIGSEQAINAIDLIDHNRAPRSNNGPL